MSVAGARKVDTAKAVRRKLRFNTIDDLLAEMDRLIEAESGGKLQSTGNWTLGQIFGHLAAWIDYGYDGYPMTVPWFIRLILKFKVKGYLKNGMPAGVKIPKTPGGTYATAALSTDEGALRLRKSLDRLKRGEVAKFDSPAFGPMSHDDRILLNLRHAELHLGFVGD